MQRKDFRMSATPPLLGSVVDRLGAEIVSGDIAEGERFRLGDVGGI